MTTTVDPNLMEQTRFLSIKEFAEQTGMSATQAHRGVADGSIKSLRVTLRGRPLVYQSEVEKFKGMTKAAPRGRSAIKEDVLENPVTSLPFTLLADLMKPSLKLREAINEMKDAELLMDKLKRGLTLTGEGLQEVRDIVENHSSR